MKNTVDKEGRNVSQTIKVPQKIYSITGSSAVKTRDFQTRLLPTPKIRDC